MPVEIDIAHVARLARLELDEAELAGYAAQLEVILDHAARVQALPTEDVPATAHPLTMINALRDDETGEVLPRDEVLEAAPDTEDGYFRVPPSMEQQ